MHIISFVVVAVIVIVTTIIFSNMMEKALNAMCVAEEITENLNRQKKASEEK